MFITNINTTFANISLKNFLFVFFVNNFLSFKKKFQKKYFKYLYIIKFNYNYLNNEKLYKII